MTVTEGTFYNTSKFLSNPPSFIGNIYSRGQTFIDTRLYVAGGSMLHGCTRIVAPVLRPNFLRRIAAVNLPTPRTTLLRFSSVKKGYHTGISSVYQGYEQGSDWRAMFTLTIFTGVSEVILFVSRDTLLLLYRYHPSIIPVSNTYHLGIYRIAEASELLPPQTPMFSALLHQSLPINSSIVIWR